MTSSKLETNSVFTFRACFAALISFAVLSFFIPGLGQLYKGQIINAMIWFVIVIAGYVAFIFPGLFLHLCCVIGATMGNPYK